MADEYTPTTEQVRKYWLGKWAPSDNLDAQFDRWLAEVERAAAVRALEEAASAWAADPDAWGDNEKDYRNELRARAAEIRAGKSE